jgi:hypothetical protein
VEELERMVAGRLRALEDVAPAAGSQAHIMQQVTKQVTVRRRRRRAAEAASACFVVALAVVVPTVLVHDGPQSRLVPGPLADGSKATPTKRSELSGQAQSGTGSAPLRGSSTGQPGLALNRNQDLAAGQVLSAFGVGTDGTVLAEGVTYSSDGSGVRDGKLWRADLTNVLSAPVPIAQPAGLYAAAGGDGLTVWPERRDADYQLMCAGPDGHPAQLGSAGVAQDPAGFHIDEDTTVWTDGAEPQDRTVWTAKGCTGAPKALVHGGYAAAFSYPYAYIMETGADGQFTGNLQRLHVETGESQTRSVPADLVDGDDVLFAAGKDTFSVSDGTKLMVFDVDTWTAKKITKALPARGNGQASLTAGDDVVVYSTRPADGHLGDDRSLVYRPGTAKARTQDGEAFAKGPWLLHRVADTYKLEKTGD